MIGQLGRGRRDPRQRNITIIYWDGNKLLRQDAVLNGTNEWRGHCHRPISSLMDERSGRRSINHQANRAAEYVLASYRAADYSPALLTPFLKDFISFDIGMVGARGASTVIHERMRPIPILILVAVLAFEV